MNPQWVELTMAHTPHRRVILDMDSSESPVHGQQEGAAYNGHFECVGRNSAVEALGHALDPFANTKIARAHLAQAAVHIGEKVVVQLLSQAVCRRVGGLQTVQHQEDVKGDHLVAAINAVGDMMIPVEAWVPGLFDQTEIECARCRILGLPAPPPLQHH